MAVEPPMNGTSFADLLVASNTATDGWFGVMVLVVVWTLIFLGLKWGTSPSKAIATASFGSFIFSLMFISIGLVTWNVVGISVMLVIAGGVAVWYEGR